MKKILFCLLLLPCLIQAQRLTVDSVLLKKQGSIPAKWVSAKTFSNIDTINEIQTLYNHNLYDLKNIDTTTRTKVLTRKATDSLINYALTGTVDTKGNWDASGNTLPSTSVKTGDKWTISVKGFVSPDSFYVGDVIIAKIDDPGQTVTNWNHIYASQPKSVNLVLAGSSQVGALKYNGRVAKGGAFHGGNVNVIADTSILNFNGNFRSNMGVFYKGISTGVSEGTNGGLFQALTNYTGYFTRIYSSTMTPLRVERNQTSGNIIEFGRCTGCTTYASIDVNGKGTFNGGIESQTVGAKAISGYSVGNYGVYGVSTTSNGVYGYSPSNYGVFGASSTSSGVCGLSTNNIGVNAQSTNHRGMQASTSTNKYIAAFTKEGTNSGDKAFIDTFGYYIGLKPTFSSVFFDSTRAIGLDVNTPKIISNAWGNLWPNSVLVGFTENKDTAIVGYTGNYNMTFDFNASVSGSADFRYHVKKRPANTTTVTTIYRKSVANPGSLVNRAMSLNYNLNAGDRVWIEVENITNGSDITVYGGALSITANYLNP